jgi:anaerobic selenocysteine-containing dehydrogenase
MHNYHRLVKGKPRWQLMMHPNDLSEHGLDDDDLVTITSRVGSVTTHVQSTNEVMPGVVSLPHGWGHNQPGVQLDIASQQKGVNCNELTDHLHIDQLSGNAALNGVPVTVSKAS